MYRKDIHTSFNYKLIETDRDTYYININGLDRVRYIFIHLDVEMYVMYGKEQNEIMLPFLFLFLFPFWVFHTVLFLIQKEC